ncbi:MAG: HAD hydrolase family protein, partial [Methanomassiliicoccales archaeon]|nr:HAD hydrolase family protein [Methanomassiliicoccales archaeon]
MKFKAGTDPVAFRSIGVIATDYDRTLTDLDLTLHRETIGAIDDASEAGLCIIIVSGRGVRFMMNLKSRFRQVDALVAENG